MSQIDNLIEVIGNYKPRSINTELPEAAILVPIIRDEDDPRIVLTRRAQHLSTHKGQVAFPGGKFDDEDVTLLNTALRESEEEISLQPNDVDVIGSLSQVVSLHGIRVTPYVGLIDSGLSLTPNLDELDSIFEVPVRFFDDAVPKRRDKMTYKGMALSVPSYDYEFKGESYEIWGLSAIVLVELLNIGFGKSITIFDQGAG